MTAAGDLEAVRRKKALLRRVVLSPPCVSVSTVIQPVCLGDTLVTSEMKTHRLIPRLRILYDNYTFYTSISDTLNKTSPVFHVKS